MPFFSQKKLRFNTPTANGLASQSTQQPPPVCTWSIHAPQPGPSPLPRSGHTLTATTNAAGELFLFGGHLRHRSRSDLYVFSTRNFSTTLLKTSGAVPTPRHAHGTALTGTTLLVCGGKAGDNDQNVLHDDSLYLLNLVSREWTRIVVNGPGPGGHSYHTTAVVGSKLFVFGGEISKKKIISDMWTLDLNYLTSQPLWKPYEPTPGNEGPLQRSRHVSVTSEDRIIIFGGYGNQHFYNDTWSFDVSTRQWTELQCTGSIPSPRAGHAAVLVDDVMYVFGGYTGEIYLDDLIGLQLSTQRWFKFDIVGPSPHRRAYHTMASDGTRVFVLGGYSSTQVDEISLIHVFDTKDIKYSEPEGNAVYPNEETTQLAWKPSTGLPTRDRKSSWTSSLETHYAPRLQNASPAVSGGQGSVQITHERIPGPYGRPFEFAFMGVNSIPKRVTEDYVNEYSTEYRANPAAPYSSSEGEVTRLELEQQRSASLAAQTERDRLIARLTEELALKSTQLEQTKANAAEAARRAELERREHADRLLSQTSLVEQRDAELVYVQAELRNTEDQLDELVVSRHQQVGQYEKELTNVRAKLGVKESELETVRLRLADAEKGRASLDELVVSHNRQVGRYERELAEVRAKLEAKESDLEAVRLRLTDAEKDLTKSKAEADSLRAKIATGSMNRDEDQATRRVMERLRFLEDEVASKRWNEKRIEEMECRNEG